MLRGLGEPLQRALVRTDVRVRTYCPVGRVESGMAYLSRRLLENTSQDAFLLALSRKEPLPELLRAP